MESDKKYSPAHLAALRRFATTISLLTVLGHTVLGFEQSYAQPLVALATAYGMQFVLELVDAQLNGRPVRFGRGLVATVDYFLSAHITALAIAMLLYYNDTLWPVAFATSVAIASKYVFRVQCGSATRHVFNPSNFGITVTLLSFPWIGLVPPWQFLTEVDGMWDWAIPAIIFLLGTYLNALFTKRIPLIVAWLASFLIQALVRSVFFGERFAELLGPATGVPAMVFTFYMAPDPATTPNRLRGQIAFGASIGLLYGALVIFHVVYGLFIALTIVCAARGLGIQWMNRRGSSDSLPQSDVPGTAVANHPAPLPVVKL